jgi:hypothetical protein
MRYPKKGEAVYVVGQLQLDSRRGYTLIPERTPALVMEGGIDANGKTHIMVPMIGEYWAHPYQIIYADTGLCADGHPRWDDEQSAV